MRTNPAYPEAWCSECGGTGCSWECEPCMHGDPCGSRCIDDLCRGSEVHYQCGHCGGTRREPDEGVTDD